MTDPRSSILELKSLILNRTDDISHLSRCRLAVGVLCCSKDVYHIWSAIMLTDIKSNRGGTCRPYWTDRQRIKKYLHKRNRCLVILPSTLDPRPSTLDPRYGTLDPRQKDRLGPTLSRTITFLFSSCCKLGFKWVCLRKVVIEFAFLTV